MLHSAVMLDRKHEADTDLFDTFGDFFRTYVEINTGRFQ